MEERYLDWLDRNDLDIVCSSCGKFVDRVNKDGLCSECEGWFRKE